MGRGGPRMIEDFLMKHLNDRTFGFRLIWINVHERIFDLMWNHQSKSGWTPDDVVVFKKWDELKGHKTEQSKEYYTEAKGRFRSALNKLETDGLLAWMKQASPDKYTRRYRILSDRKAKKRKNSDQQVEAGVSSPEPDSMYPDVPADEDVGEIQMLVENQHSLHMENGQNTNSVEIAQQDLAHLLENVDMQELLIISLQNPNIDITGFEASSVKTVQTQAHFVPDTSTANPNTFGTLISVIPQNVNILSNHQFTSETAASSEINGEVSGDITGSLGEEYSELQPVQLNSLEHEASSLGEEYSELQPVQLSNVAHEDSAAGQISSFSEESSTTGEITEESILEWIREGGYIP